MSKINEKTDILISLETKARILQHFRKVLAEHGDTMRADVREYYERVIRELEINQ
jgi:hypothetical protein